MKIYRRIINKKNANDDCIYELVAVRTGYQWHYLEDTYRSEIDALILYKQREGDYWLSGILDFDPQDLELSDGNSAEYK